jgi:Tol biopolymer transport system component
VRRRHQTTGLRAATFVALALLGAIVVPAAIGTVLPVRTYDVAALAAPAAGASSAAANPAISGDGSVVAFNAPGPGGAQQVYAVNLLTGQRRLVSAAPDGSPGNGDSTAPSISSDGSVIAFSSTASNLASGSAPSLSNVYARSANGPVELVSGAPAGPADGSSNQAVVSSDGGFVAFTSVASNLVPADTNGKADVFVRNLAANTTTLVSSVVGGASSNGSSSNPAISAQGAFVSFDSDATNIVAGVNNHLTNVFVRNMRTGAVELASVSSGGVLQNKSVAAPFSQISSISADGRYVVFDSDADNLVRGDINRHTDVFLRDRASRTTRLISENNAGFEGNNDSFAPTISGTGRVVAFESFSSNLGHGGGPRENVFVRDLATGTTSVIDVGPLGERPQAEQVRELLQRPILSSTGDVAAFESTAHNLTLDPSPQPHVLVRLLDPPIASFVSAPPSRTRQARVRVRLAADDPHATSFACRIDGGPYFGCGPGSVLLPAVGRGRHVLQIRAGGPGMLYDPLALRATFTRTA